MNIQELKESVIGHTFPDGLQIFVASNDNFIIHQYLHEICQGKGLKLNWFEVKWLDEIKDVLPQEKCGGVFDNMFEDNELRVYNIAHNVDYAAQVPIDQTNSIIITPKVSEEVVDAFGNNITIFPTLTDMQIKDYVHTQVPGLNDETINWLLETTHKNMFRLEQECNRFKCIEKEKQQQVFDKMIDEGGYDDLTNKTIFDLTNAITKRDKKTIDMLMHEIDSMDVTDMYLLTVLHNSFKNLLGVQCSNGSANANSLGLKPNQFNAIKYNCGKYSNVELVDRLRYINSLDYKLKTGLLDIKDMVPLLLTRLL